MLCRFRHYHLCGVLDWHCRQRPVEAERMGLFQPSPQCFGTGLPSLFDPLVFHHNPCVGTLRIIRQNKRNSTQKAHCQIKTEAKKFQFLSNWRRQNVDFIVLLWYNIFRSFAAVAELADARDLKSLCWIIAVSSQRCYLLGFLLILIGVFF